MCNNPADNRLQQEKKYSIKNIAEFVKIIAILIKYIKDIAL